MDNPENQQHGGPHAAEHRPHRRPIHHSPFFWVAAVCILAAMLIFVFTDSFAITPASKPVPVAGH